MKNFLAFIKLAFVLAVLFSLGLYPVSMVAAQVVEGPDASLSSEDVIAPPLTPGPGSGIPPAPGADADIVVPDGISPAPDVIADSVTPDVNQLPPRVPSGSSSNAGGSSSLPAEPENHAPVITIAGNPVTIVVGGIFSELAVTATDQEEGDITSRIVTISNQTVDTNTVGTYRRTYYVSDSQGLSDTQTRTVNVVAADSNSNSGSSGGGSRGNRNNSSGSNGQVLGASDFKFLTDLREGMRNNDVMELQKRLRAEGFFFYPVDTGYFGSFTRAAVMLYQYAHYADIGYITGFFGPLTRAVINR